MATKVVGGGAENLENQEIRLEKWIERKRAWGIMLLGPTLYAKDCQD